MYKKILWPLISLMIIVLIYFGNVVYKDLKSVQKEKSELGQIVKVLPKKEHTETVETVSKDEKVVTVNIVDENYRNPFNQKYNQGQLTDAHYLEYIHKMSHQKIIADSKWGFFEMTDERIDWLIEALDHDATSRLTERDIYLDILTRWKNKDFSQVDKDHNTVWRLQGGVGENAAGEATGISDEESEKKYIEINIEH